MFNCDHCHLAFATIWDLNIHVRFCHVDPSFWGQPGKNPMVDQSGKYPPGMSPFPGADMSQGIPVQREMFPSYKDTRTDEEKNYYASMLPDHLREAQNALYANAKQKKKEYITSPLYDQSKDRLPSLMQTDPTAAFSPRVGQYSEPQSKDRLPSLMPTDLTSAMFNQRINQYNDPLKDRISQYNEQPKDRISQYNEQPKERIIHYNEQPKDRNIQYNEQPKDRLIQYDEQQKERINQYDEQLKDRLNSLAPRVGQYDEQLLKDRLTSLQPRVSQYDEQLKDRLNSLAPRVSQYDEQLLKDRLTSLQPRVSQYDEQLKDRLTSLQPRVSQYDEQLKDRLTSLQPRVSQYDEQLKDRLTSLQPRVSQYDEHMKDRLTSLAPTVDTSAMIYSSRMSQYNEPPKERLTSLSPTDSSGIFSPRSNQPLGLQFHQRPEETSQAYDYSSTRPPSTSNNVSYSPSPSSELYRTTPMSLQYGFSSNNVDHMGGGVKPPPSSDESFTSKGKAQDLDINSIFRLAADFSKGIKNKAVTESIENFVNQAHKGRATESMESFVNEAHKGRATEAMESFVNQSHKTKTATDTMEHFVNQSNKSKPVTDTMENFVNQSHKSKPITDNMERFVNHSHKPFKNGSEGYSAMSDGEEEDEDEMDKTSDAILENGASHSITKKMNDTEEWAIMNSLSSFPLNSAGKIKRKGRKPKEPIICRFCGVEFIKKADLASHVKVHSDEFTFNCIMCGEVFETSAQLRKHRRTHRPPNDQEHYECILCGLLLKNWPRVEAHVRSHTGLRPFKCDTCGADFAAQYGLKKHLRIHTGDKPYKCEMCPLRFTDNHNLQTHIRKHTGEKPFECTLCGAKFTLKNSLRVHSMMHRGDIPFTCEICMKPFYRKQHLISHRRVHTGEKPYVCLICKKGFSRNHHLTIHTRSHTGEKPYKCHKCDDAFIRKSHLDTHLKHHVAGVSLYQTKAGIKKIKTVRVCKSKRSLKPPRKPRLKKSTEVSGLEVISKLHRTKTKKRLKKECLRGTRISKRLFTKKKNEATVEIKVEPMDEAAPEPNNESVTEKEAGAKGKKEFDAGKCYEENINEYIERLMAEKGELNGNVNTLKSDKGESLMKEEEDVDGGSENSDTLLDKETAKAIDKHIEKQIEDKFEEFSAAINLIRKVKS